MKYILKTKIILVCLLMVFATIACIDKVSAADYMLYCVYTREKPISRFPSEIMVTQELDGTWEVVSDTNDKLKEKVEYSGKKCPDYLGYVRASKTVYLLNAVDVANEYACKSSNDGLAADRDYCETMKYIHDAMKSDETNASDKSGGTSTKHSKNETETFEDGNCGIFGKRTIELLEEVINLIRYLVPIIIVIFGILDFAKIMFSGEEKVFKQAAVTFVKRLLIGIVFMFIPAIVGLLVNLSGLLLDYNVDEVFCGLF